jgi:hypothetical protein
VRRRHEPPPNRRVSARHDRGGGRQRQEGNDRSDAARLLTRGMLRRVQAALRETECASRPPGAGTLGSTKRACRRGRVGKRNEPCPDRDARCPSPRAEQAVEVVEVHEGGTRCAAGGAGTPKGGGNVDREWTLGMEPEAGINAGEAQERRIRRLVRVGSWRAEGDAKLMEDVPGVFYRTPQAGRAREHPEGQCGDAQGRGGSSEGPASCYCV